MKRVSMFYGLLLYAMIMTSIAVAMIIVSVYLRSAVREAEHRADEMNAARATEFNRATQNQHAIDSMIADPALSGMIITVKTK